MIRVTLSGRYTATAAGITVDLDSRRRGSPICTLARKLAEAGHDPAEELHVYRGSTLCFLPRPLGLWAGLIVEEGDNTSRQARFGKHRLRASEPTAGSADSAAAVGRFSGHLAVSGGRVPEKAPAALTGEPHP